MNYRIYVDGKYGKTLLTSVNDLEECLRITDNVINGNCNRCLLVIRHDIELNMDEVIIAYYGNNIDRYNKDKFDLLYKYAYEKRREQLKEASDNFTKKFGGKNNEKIR